MVLIFFVKCLIVCFVNMSNKAWDRAPSPNTDPSNTECKYLSPSVMYNYHIYCWVLYIFYVNISAVIKLNICWHVHLKAVFKLATKIVILYIY